MKKLFIFLSLIYVFALNVKAQESATFDKALTYTETWFSYMPSTDSRAHTATDSLWYFTCFSEKYLPVTYDIKLKLDKISGTAKVVPVILKAKKWDSDAYLNLDTITWVSGVDTTINFIKTANPVQYRFFQIYMKANGDGQVVNIDELSMKFWQ
jgi:hypothetical protein